MKSVSLSTSLKDNAPATTRPVFVSLAFFLVIVVLRFGETFVPGLDALPYRSIVSRVPGLLAVLVYLWAERKSIASIGLHTRNLGKAFLIGGLSLLVLYAALYIVQLYRLSSAGETAHLVFALFDPEHGTMYGLDLTLIYLLGQIVNAFMEESLFRGVMLPQLMHRFKFWQANMLQAFLFGMAHLAWSLAYWMRGQATETIAEAGSLLLATIVGGLVFGYLYYRTGSLWTAIFAHLIDNAVVRLLHIQTANRLSAETDILMLASVGFILLIVLAYVVAKRSRLQALEPWGAN